MNQVFDKAKSRTLRTEVVDMIRDAIVTGKLKPGEHLKETILAEQMSVSRSPVREALRQLEQEGLVVSIPNQGSFVKAFDEDDVREIFTLRTALEELACEIVLRNGNLSEDDLQLLEAYIEQQREAIESRDFDSLTELDMDFHEYICSRSGLKRLLKMWQSLRAQIQVLFYQRFHAFAEVPETVDTDHSEIIDALREGDADKFSEISREVNERVAEECVRMLRAIGNNRDS